MQNSNDFHFNKRVDDSLNMRHDDPRIDFTAPFFFFLLGWMKNRVKGTFREFIYTLCTDISTNLSHILYQPLKKKKNIHTLP